MSYIIKLFMSYRKKLSWNMFSLSSIEYNKLSNYFFLSVMKIFSYVLRSRDLFCIFDIFFEVFNNSFKSSLNDSAKFKY